MTERAESRVPVRLLVAVVASHLAGLSGAGAAPLIIGSLMDRLKMNGAAAGVLVSTEMIAIAATSIGVSGLLTRHSRRVFARTGVFVAFAGHAISALATSYDVLAGARLLAGLGGGVILAAGNAAGAGAREPDRLFAGVVVGYGLAATLLLVGIPYAIVPYGPTGAFTTLAVLNLLSLPFLAWLPDPRSSEGERTRRGAPNRGLGYLGLVAIGLTSLGQGAVWAFTERIGVRAGLAVEEVGGVLAAVTLLGLGGAAFASWLGTRTGRVAPIIAGLAAQIWGAIALVHSSSPLGYTAVLLAWGFAFFFTFPYLMGAMAALDPLGRWTVSAGAADLLGSAAGPALGGALIVGTSYGGLGVLVAISGAIALAFVFPVARFVNARPVC